MPGQRTQIIEPPKSGPPEALYAKLQPRWCGLEREEVERHQRARIYGAMIEATADRGYARASIKYVSALAGVSRQTFYDRFGTKDECFLKTYDLIVARAVKRIAAAYGSEQDWQARLRRAFEEFAAEAVENPKAARLALVEALCAGPAGLARMDRARQVFEWMVSSSFDQAPDGVKLPPVVVKGIACGIERITRGLLVDRRIEELPALIDELLAWALTYRSRAVAELVARPPSYRDRPRTTRATMGTPVDAERMRILRAAAEIAASEGYDGLTTGEIVDRGEISYETFEASWANTEECFLDALDLLGLEALAVAGDTPPGVENRLEAVHDGLARLLEHVADDEVLRRLAFAEIFAVGPAGVKRREQLLHSFVELLSSSLPWTHERSELESEATVGAIWGIIHDYVHRDAAHLLPYLVDEIAYLALAPAIGAEAAVEGILACGATDIDTRQVGDILRV